MERYSRPLTVGFISAGTLAYEILLVRVFAIEQFHHFAYMAIGVAMLGFGASGTFLALARLGRRQSLAWFAAAALLTPISLVASPALVHLVPLDSTQLAWDLSQWPRLGLVYLLLATPFAVGAMVILLALTLEPERVGWTYSASFLGAGAGTAIAVAALWVVFPERALALPACVASLGAVSAAATAPRRLHKGLSLMTVLVVAAVLARPLWRLRITPYKGLPQVEAYPEARRVGEHTSPLGWVVAVEAPAFRYAPGLSLQYRGPFPRQTALFVDGETAGAANAAGDDSAAVAILDWLPSAVPYALGGREKVLVMGAGGGTEVWNAVAHGARDVTAVELNPQLAALGGSPGQPASLGRGTRVEWVIADARSYVARSDERFDLITFPAARALGGSAAGVYALSEDFLHTAEAYASYLSHLSDDGVLAISRWLTVPPRANVRVILTAGEALRRVAPGVGAKGLVVVHSWATGTVLVKPSGFSSEDVGRLERWARERGFDLDWYPGIVAPGPAFNVLDEPVLFRAAAAVAGGPESAAEFASGYPFNVAPASDMRPYAHHYLRAGSIGTFLAQERGSWLAFAEWGYIALFATLVQSFVLAMLLLVVPAAIGARTISARKWFPLVAYFGAIGVAYLAAEIAAIQQLDLLLGHPVYAVAAVLTAFLVCSGLGAASSDHLPAAAAWRTSATAAGLLALYAIASLALVHLLQPTALPVRVLAALLLLAPLAWLMGTPFPLGLRSLAGGVTEPVAWAWAANGFASVVATPLAALIGLEAGSRVLLLVAALAYAFAAALHLGFSPGATAERAG